MLNLEHIAEIVAVLRDSGLTEIEVRRGDVTLRLRRPSLAPPAANLSPGATLVAGPPTALAPVAVSAVRVSAMLVGSFHALPEPIEEGAFVAQGQILGQIESMRLMNDCLSPVEGRVVAAPAKDGQPVEYGQTLFEVAPRYADGNASVALS